MTRRPDISALHAEIRGQIVIPLDDTSFTLSARADRIEKKAGGYAILDYKTGRLPGHDEVKVGFAPQLTLEAAILREGGFPDIPRGVSVAELVYVGLKGGEPPGEMKVVKLKDSTPDIEADAALQKLVRNARRFLIDGEPYSSLVSPMWKGRRYGDYDHLARVKEWSLTGGVDEGGGE
jgi:ATP-dependent helicase/nuclease subunit B